MKMRSSSFLRQRGMTLVEMIVATGVFTIAMAALISASISMQMSFSATEDYFTGQGDQLRVMDYFNTDLRRAMAVSISSNTVSYKPPGAAAAQTYTYSNSTIGQATKYFTMVIPNYRNQTTTPSSINVPQIVSGKVTYGSNYNNPLVVCYYLLGNSLYRAEVDPNLSSTDSRNNPRSIADNVSDFNITDSFVANPLTTQTFVSVSATFAPKYSRGGWAAALKSTTASNRVGTTIGTKIQLRNIF